MDDKRCYISDGGTVAEAVTIADFGSCRTRDGAIAGKAILRRALPPNAHGSGDSSADRNVRHTPKHPRYRPHTPDNSPDQPSGAIAPLGSGRSPRVSRFGAYPCYAY